MNLLELQKILGNRIKEEINSKNLNESEKCECHKTSENIAKLAKQMINNADVILRSEKLITDKQLKNTIIENLIKGSDNGNNL